jgi:hypothetical protein
MLTSDLRAAFSTFLSSLTFVETVEANFDELMKLMMFE